MNPVDRLWRALRKGDFAAAQEQLDEHAVIRWPHSGDRFDRAVIWANATDDDLRAFFTAAGFAPDGAHRTLDLTGDGSLLVKQVRLHASIVEAPT